jgi:hypothetical protein
MKRAGLSSFHQVVDDVEFPDFAVRLMVEIAIDAQHAGRGVGERLQRAHALFDIDDLPRPNFAAQHE